MRRPVITFDADAHAYTVNGREVPSVTHVIKSVLGSGFESIRDPQWYMQRGRAIHACAAYIAQGIEFDAPGEIHGHVAALRSFWADVRPEPEYVETPIASAVYGYAGTLDLGAYVESEPRLCLFDYKSSLSEERTRIQLGAYSLALKETTGDVANTGVGVWLRGDGTYRMTKPIDLRPAARDFLNLLGAYNLMQRVEKTTPMEE